MRIRPRTVAVSALLATSLVAQSFNLDVGSIVPGGAGSGTPAPTYGAAAHQPGTWNWLANVSAGPFALSDLSGAATGVVCTRNDGMGGLFGFNNLMTTGYFQSLMDDGHAAAAGMSMSYRFTGLAPGRYVVFTYAWAPDSASYLTSVSVQGSTSPNPQVVGGALVAVNTFTPGITHAVHAVTLAAGADLVIDWSAAQGAGTIDGFQICRDYRFTLSQTAASGALTMTNACGVPGNTHVNLVTFTQGSFPNGALFGIDLSISDALAEVALGPPFFGTLDGNGSATVVIPGPLPSGTTIYCVGLELDASLTSVAAFTNPFAYTLL